MTYREEKKGFSLIEILIAIALLGVIIVVICGVFVIGLESIKKGKSRATAFHIANKKFAELSNIDVTDDRGIPVDQFELFVKGYQNANQYGNTVRIPWDTPGGTPDYDISGMEVIEGKDFNFEIKIEGYDSDLKVKKLSVEVKWIESEEGEKKLVLYSLLAKKEI